MNEKIRIEKAKIVALRARFHDLIDSLPEEFVKHECKDIVDYLIDKCMLIDYERWRYDNRGKNMA